MPIVDGNQELRCTCGWQGKLNDVRYESYFAGGFFTADYNYEYFCPSCGNYFFYIGPAGPFASDISRYVTFISSR